jgi:hypothetical protein
MKAEHFAFIVVKDAHSRSNHSVATHVFGLLTSCPGHRQMHEYGLGDDDFAMALMSAPLIARAHRVSGNNEACCLRLLLVGTHVTESPERGGWERESFACWLAVDGHNFPTGAGMISDVVVTTKAATTTATRRRRRPLLLRSDASPQGGIEWFLTNMVYWKQSWASQRIRGKFRMIRSGESMTRRRGSIQE